MEEKKLTESLSCLCSEGVQIASFQKIDLIKSTIKKKKEEACCGSGTETPSNPYEKPGYKLLPFVKGFYKSKIGQIPVVKTTLDKYDILSTIKVRIGINRDSYKVAPGLYCVGNPDPSSPVLVSANYKLSFDHLRKHLKSINAWIMVLDTHGVNVWCSAGKGIFSTDELVKKIQSTGLEKIVNHNKIILPQLSASGVSVFKVKKACGFKVIWGPVRASDLKLFLVNNMKANTQMRQVTFSLAERVVLIPVELYLAIKPALMIMAVLFILSGFGPGIFSLTNALSRGFQATLSVITGVIAGVVLTPILLQYIPIRPFALKGSVIGLVSMLLLFFILGFNIGLIEMIALMFFGISISSYLAMNFTGTTPFTSPSGVEKEMRKAIPLQTGSAVIGLILWVYSAF